MRELEWVDTKAGLEESVKRAVSADIVALDAEMDSYFCYYTKLCLVQMSVGETDYLIDPLAIDDLTPLNRLTEDKSIMKVFHAGENDVPYFRDRGVEFSNIFDTHIAAKLLNLPTRGLGGLVERYFDVVLPKDQSRADWRIRPLPDEQLKYARQDTLYLSELASKLDGELHEAQAMREADHAFKALEKRELRPREFNPDGWAKFKGVRELSGVQRAILRELYLWREKQAEKADLAVFRVAGNHALMSLARKRFRNPDQLKGWAKCSIFKKRAEEVIELMERGRAQGEIPLPEVSKRRSDDWSAADEKLFNKLRNWRNQESEKQEIEPSRIFSNRQLKTIVRESPASPEELGKVEGLEPWKLEQYAERLLQLLKAGSD